MADAPSKTGTGEVAFGPGTLVERARELVRDALTMLGEGPGATVEDEVVTDAGVLLLRAGEMLEDAYRIRIDERVTVEAGERGDGERG